MVSRIRIIYPSGLNKGFGLKFCVGYRVWHETPGEGRETHRPKRCEYNDEDEDNSPISLNDKNISFSVITSKQLCDVMI